ncbi:RNA polymerase sigma factor [Sphingomonas sp.]|uniref:RNA polymerase sigma factor n=1 Tax=Sphingomonas sp. TaxID=28214 RepID=UPI0025F41FC1|nr:RNA polymerase sigma factor [Sphingomonas sp.]
MGSVIGPGVAGPSRGGCHVTAVEPIDVGALFIRRRAAIENHISRYVRCRQTAADLASDLYLKLRRVDATFTSEREAVTYLYRMARTMSIDHVRIEARRGQILAESGDALETDHSSGPENVAAARSDMQIVEGALGELPEKCREILYLSRVYGLTHSEIAERMDVSRSLVEKYVTMALAHCRQRLKEVSELEVMSSKLTERVRRDQAAKAGNVLRWGRRKG